MLNEVPQWLVQAFVRSVQAAGSTQSKEQLAENCHHLIEAWSSPDRSYHGLQHVVDLLTRVETLLPETGDPALVRLAAWFHGVCFSTSAEATYTHNGGENEEASALVAQEDLRELGVDPEKAARVATLIRGLRAKKSTASPTETSKFQAVDIDEQALRDAHLGTLAVEPQRYKRYLELVEREYAHIPREDFLKARRAIVSKLLARRQLFVTPLARQWDEAARENLSAELQRLNDLLADTEPPARIPSVSPTSETTHVPPTVREEEPSVRSGDDVVAPADKPNVIDSLLTASENEDAAERAAAAREAERLSRVEPDTTGQLSREDTVSSLESCVDKLDPGVKETPALTPEQKRQRRREEIAAQMRRRIEERHRAADTARLERTRVAGERAKTAEAGAGDASRLEAAKPEEQDIAEPERPSPAPLLADPVAPEHGTEVHENDAKDRGHTDRPIAQSPPPSRPESAGNGSNSPREGARGGSGASHRTSQSKTPVEKGANPDEGTAGPSDTPQRVSIWERLSNSATSASTPEWIDDDHRDSDAARRALTATTKRDLIRDIPHLTDDEDVRASDLPEGPSHGIEKEPEM